jgi:hypothetical protein
MYLQSQHQTARLLLRLLLLQRLASGCYLLLLVLLLLLAQGVKKTVKFDQKAADQACP